LKQAFLLTALILLVEAVAGFFSIPWHSSPTPLRPRRLGRGPIGGWAGGRDTILNSCAELAGGVLDLVKAYHDQLKSSTVRSAGD